MDCEKRSTGEDRLGDLEAKCLRQEAQIDALVLVLSDLLAAHAVLHKDLRLLSFLKDDRDYATQKQNEGGTKRVSSSYFGARADIFAKLLEECANSQVFDTYWSRRFFWRREEAERRMLKKIRQAVERKRDGL